MDERASKQIINLGGTEECTINEACDTLIDVMGGGEKIYLEERHEVRNAFSTYEKSVELLEYEHKTSLSDGLKEMWEWAKSKPMKHRRPMHYEVKKGIYSFWE